MKPLWSRRALPEVHRRASHPAKARALAYLPVSEYHRTAENLSTGELGPFLDRTTFTRAEHIGTFETIFSQMPSKALKGLAAGRDWVTHRDTRYLYHRDRGEATLSIRQGNRWGTIIFAAELLEGTSDEAEVMDVLGQAGQALRPVGLRAQDLRSPGYCASLILRDDLIGRRPPPVHAQRFLNSFRGPRFEATSFGTIPQCHDYDITSAYPAYFSQLQSTSAVVWRDAADLSLIDDACYAAILADVYVPVAQDRGPLAYRYGESNLYFPVGALHKVWLNLPEIRLLEEHRDLGVITKVYEGSWALPFADVRPFADIVTKLYRIRQEHPEIAPFVKRILVAMWGKTQSRYQVGRVWMAPKYWNPVYSSHVTATMRVENFRRTLGQSVYGEFVDGFATAGPMQTSTGLGGLRHEGSGSMLVVTDLFKQSSWKRLFADFAGMMADQPLARAVTVRAAYARTLAEVAEAGEPGAEIGRPEVAEWPIPIGSSIRVMNGGGFTCEDFLGGMIGTRPPTEDKLEAMAWARSVESPLPATLGEVF